MTIYYCTIKSTSLSNFASSAKIINLCIYLCKHIYAHLYNEIATDDVMSQVKLKQHFEILKENFKILKNNATDASILRVEYPVKVTFLHTRFFASRNVLSYAQSFNLNKLSGVPIRVLLSLLIKLITESLTSLKPYLLCMPDQERQACYEILTTLPVDTSEVVTKHLDVYAGDVIKVAMSLAFITQIKVSFCDNRTEKVDLNK